MENPTNAGQVQGGQNANHQTSPQGGDEARGQRHDAGSNTDMKPVTVARFVNPENNKPLVNGLMFSHARNDPSRITGLTLRKKKEFVADVKRIAALPKDQPDPLNPQSGMKGEGVQLTDREAQKRFDEYRKATYTEWSKHVGTELIAGRLATDGIKLNAKGEAVALPLVRVGQKQKDEVQSAKETIAMREGIPQAELDRMFADYRKNHPTVDIPATAKDESRPAIDVAATEVRQPQAVATAN